LGLKMKMGKISAVQPGSPAMIYGLKPGDAMHAIQGEVIDDPIALPEKLRRLASGAIDIEYARQLEKGGEIKETATEVQLREPTTRGTSVAGLPMAVPALGLAYNVQNFVGGVIPGSSAAQYADELIGNEIVKITIPAAKGGAAPTRKVEIEFGQDAEKQQRNNWPFFMDRLGYLPAGTPVNVWYLPKGSDEPKKLELALSESDEEFLPYRGLVFATQKDIKKADSLGEAIGLAAAKTRKSLLLVFSFLDKLRRRELSPSMLGGPITIAQAAGHYAFEGFGPFLIFLTMLSANLAVLNFLPIPVLDGGHMVFLIYEGIFRRPVSDKVVIIMHWIGLLLILTLMVYVVGLDISRLITRLFG
jgi:regulator of sigma E protease